MPLQYQRRNIPNVPLPDERARVVGAQALGQGLGQLGQGLGQGIGDFMQQRQKAQQAAAMQRAIMEPVQVPPTSNAGVLAETLGDVPPQMQAPPLDLQIQRMMQQAVGTGDMQHAAALARMLSSEQGAMGRLLAGFGHETGMQDRGFKHADTGRREGYEHAASMQGAGFGHEVGMQGRELGARRDIAGAQIAAGDRRQRSAQGHERGMFDLGVRADAAGDSRRHALDIDMANRNAALEAAVREGDQGRALELMRERAVIEDRMAQDERAFRTDEREAGQAFEGGQRDTDRNLQTSLFTLGQEGEYNRLGARIGADQQAQASAQGFARGEREAGQTFRAGEAGKDRTFRAGEADKDRTFQAAEAGKGRTFSKQQAAAQRAYEQEVRATMGEVEREIAGIKGQSEMFKFLAKPLFEKMLDPKGEVTEADVDTLNSLLSGMGSSYTVEHDSGDWWGWGKDRFRILGGEMFTVPAR